MHSLRCLTRTALVLALCQSTLALADTDPVATPTLAPVPVQTDAQREQAVREEMHRSLLRLAEAGALGDDPQQTTLDLSESAQRSSNLGILVDSGNGSADGVHVLGVTPGSNAERIGVQAGDVITAINTTSLRNLGQDASGHAAAGALLKQTVDQLKDGEPLRLEVSRHGQSLALNAPLHALYLPAMRLQLGAAALLTAASTDTGGCGRISEFDVAPRQQQLHRAIIINIDGKLPGPRGQQSFPVPTGPHTVEVAEAIESRYLTFNDRIRNASPHYKTLTVDVAANTTYLIAARLNTETRNDPKTFWDPVMWKATPETCR